MEVNLISYSLLIMNKTTIIISIIILIIISIIIINKKKDNSTLLKNVNSSDELCINLDKILNSVISISSLNNKLKQIGKINTSSGFVSFQSNYPIITNLLFSPVKSCINKELTITISITAKINIELNDVVLVLAAEEKIGKILIEGIISFDGSITNGIVSLNNFTISSLNVKAPSRPDFNTLIRVFNLIPFITMILNSNLTILLPISYTFPKLEKIEKTSTIFAIGNEEEMSEEETKIMISQLLQRQINALILKKEIQDTKFKVCGNCKDSTLNLIELGETVWEKDDGCAGAKLPTIGCVGCSWAYEAGINTISGLGNMKLRQLSLDNLVLLNSNTVRYYFNFILESGTVYIYYTAQAKPCTGSLIGPYRSSLKIPGTPSVNARAYLEGTYDSSMKLAIFKANNITFESLKLRLDIPTDWLKIRTGNDVADTILGPIFDTLLAPTKFGVNLFQDIINKFLCPKIEGIIKNITKNLITKLPNEEIPIFNANPINYTPIDNRDRLESGDYLLSGQSIKSRDNKYGFSLYFQPKEEGGEIASGSPEIWKTSNDRKETIVKYSCNKNCSPGNYFIMQEDDGDLEVRNGAPWHRGDIVWDTGKHLQQGKYITVMQEDGNLCTYSNGKNIWCSGTNGK
jgi:hypothetical protein